jgi:peptide chain release factor 2
LGFNEKIFFNLYNYCYCRNYRVNGVVFSRSANKENALIILKGKIYKLREEERNAKEKGMYISKSTSVEWGNQIRSYVLHPYKMVKDHRTDIETSDVEAVLEEGDLDKFIEAEKSL